MIEEFINREHKHSNVNGFDIILLSLNKVEKELNKSFVTHKISILLIKSGSFKISLSGKIFNLIKGDVFIIPAKSLCLHFSGSSKLKILISSFTSDFVFRNFIKKDTISLLNIFMLKNAIKIKVSDSNFLILMLTGKIVWSIFYEVKKNKTESKLLKTGIDFFLLILAYGCDEYQINYRTGLSNLDVLMWRFFSLLANQGTEQHGINFYAESLCVTKGYLNRVVKQKTGKTIKGLIAEIIIYEAKKLLEGNLPITQIAKQLEFDSVSSFSTFFKKHTEVNPSAYRVGKRTNFRITNS